MSKLTNFISQHKALAAGAGILALAIVAAVVLPLALGGDDEGEPTAEEAVKEPDRKADPEEDEGSPDDQGSQEGEQPSGPDDGGQPEPEGGGDGGGSEPQPQSLREALRETFGDEVFEQLDREDFKSLRRELRGEGAGEQFFAPGTEVPPGDPEDFLDEGESAP